MNVESCARHPMVYVSGIQLYMLAWHVVCRHEPQSKVRSFQSLFSCSWSHAPSDETEPKCSTSWKLLAKQKSIFCSSLPRWLLVACQAAFADVPSAYAQQLWDVIERPPFYLTSLPGLMENRGISQRSSSYATVLCLIAPFTISCELSRDSVVFRGAPCIRSPCGMTVCSLL